MKYLTHAALLFSTPLLLVGCSNGYNDATVDLPAQRPAGASSYVPPPPPPPPPPGPASSLGGDRPSLAADERPVEQPAAPPSTQRQPGPALPSASVRQPSIRLSAGVALPQSLPMGTVMSFSVDYQFTQGQPNPSWQYVWVIEPARGEPVRQDVRLTDQGTLPAFVQQLRPEHGPFQTHIEDSSGNRLSRSVPLR